MKRRCASVMAWCWVLLAPASPADEFELAPGSYDISARMSMPHLDEMRRIVTQERRCVSDGKPQALFPVLRQPALRGCNFGYGAAEGLEFEYLLVCQSARVASGKVRLTRDHDSIVGRLEVKMGGKNMTFAQRIEATRRADCAEN